ncbi:hypothetical protein N0V88_005492 [Collariella sp. IMI 366227]|nr:hypothetical protein N0V88_005492 [Collariella sp. IMI 366227]
MEDSLDLPIALRRTRRSLAESSPQRAPASPIAQTPKSKTRRVLDGRVKRRIRRNGLSEEMNNISTERRRRARENKEEVERLKATLAEKDDEIAKLHDETVVVDTDRVWALERQVAALKKELAAHSGVQEVPSSPVPEWARPMPDPFTDGFINIDVDNDLDNDNDDFGANSMVELSGLEVRLTTVLQSLSDRSTVLAELDSSLKNLGFPGSDGLEVVNSLLSSFRTARLALEYLTPGELTLPLSGSGAEILDLLLTRLRILADRNREQDATIDENSTNMGFLREQLRARTKDREIAELKVALGDLTAAAERYTMEISALESLVQRFESDLAASKASHTETLNELTATKALHEQTTTHLHSATTALNTTSTTLAETTTALATLQQSHAHLTTNHTTLQSTYTTTLTWHKEQLTNLLSQHTTVLAERDARLTDLRRSFSHLQSALTHAGDETHRVRVENTHLLKENGRLVGEKERLLFVEPQ